MENRNRNVWIIVAVVAVLVCCLLAVLAAGIGVWAAGWFADIPMSGGFEFDQVVETREMSFEVGAAPVLQLDNVAGNIRVRAGGEGVISATADLRARGAASLRRLSIQPSQEGDTVRIRTERTAGALVNVAVDWDITVPEGTTIELTDGAGDVSISDVEGNITAHTGAGNVRVTGSRGPVRLDTGAGNIEYEGQPDGTSTFDTGAGNIELTLPRDFAGSVDLSTGIGSVDVGGFDVDGSVSAGSARGTIGGGGGATIQAHTGAGNVDLVRR